MTKRKGRDRRAAAQAYKLPENYDPNALILDPEVKPVKKESTAPKMNPKKKRRLEKYIEKKLKKEERVERLERLSKSSFKSDLLVSTKTIGQGNETKKEKLKRSLLETRMGLPLTHEDVHLLKEKKVAADESEEDENEGESDVEASSSQPKVEEKILDLQEYTEILNPTLPPSPSESDDKSKFEKPILLERTVSDMSGKKSFYVLPNRKPEIQESRMQLPVCNEEQAIMEAIYENDIIIICGETGSGKTTQVPQFLYEAGFGHAQSPFPGKVAITQPRRVAAVSVAKRVAEELNLPESIVSHHIRYDSSVSASSVMTFMTDGILLKEMSSDFVLSRYSCLVIDEAHERSLNTDILLGLLSRSVKLRREMFDKGESKGIIKSPLKLVIMSATLRVEDFTLNSSLFPIPPPIIHIKARQHPVTVHFNRKTPDDYLSETLKKVGKIHANLPEGGILVFLSGQNEIHALAKKLRKKYPFPSSNEVAVNKSKVDKVKESENETDVVPALSVEEGVQDPNEILEQVEVDCSDNNDFTSSFEEDDDDDEFPNDTKDPLYVLPLYALLPTKEQMKIFESPPPGSRLCVLATNVAETSLTIPNIKYVVDTGKVKERKHQVGSRVQSFKVGWISKASAEQRSGRAGRTGPGHCYRLYSSAVFESEFEPFSLPEILRIPIEGVYLQMKSMHIDTIVNFPFPTAPDKAQLQEAEKLLVSLGALEKDKLSITSLGRKMASFPLSPRFAKMLLLGMANNMTEPAISLVASLSVGDPFVRDLENGIAGEEEDETTAQDRDEKSKLRSKYFRVHAEFAAACQGHKSDLLKIFMAFRAFEENPSEKWCQENFLRFKAMKEMSQLKVQLSTIMKNLYPTVNVSKVTGSSFGSRERRILLQMILAGFIDQVAMREEERKPGIKYFTYSSSCGGPEFDLMIHPSSSLFTDAKKDSCPRFIVYEELVQSAHGSGPSDEHRRLCLKGISVIEKDWIAKAAHEICTFSKPLFDNFPPRYDALQDCMLYQCQPTFGPKAWPLPLVERGDLKSLSPRQLDILYRHFAKLLLEGKILSPTDNLNFCINQYSSQLNSNTNLLLKPWTQAKLVELLVPLKSKSILRAADLIAKWNVEPTFLLSAYLLWIPSELHEQVKKEYPFSKK